MNRIRHSVLTSGGFLIGSMILSNFLNFAFNAFLGRALSFHDFALITLANSIWYLFFFVLEAFNATVNHRVAYLTARIGISEGIHFYRHLRTRLIPYVAVLTVLWVIAIPLLTSYFRLDNPLLVVSFTPVVLVGFYYALTRALLFGRFMFHFIAVVNLVEAGSKLLIALLLVERGYPELAYLSIPASIIIGLSSAALLVFVTSPRDVDPQKHAMPFPVGFYLASFMTGLATTAFLTCDVILAKHYFHPNVAGVYALLSLVGKMIFFFGSLFAVFTIPFASRDEGSHRDPNRSFYFIFMYSALLTIAGTIMIGPFGPFFLPVMFGDKIFSVLPYLTKYASAIGLFTLASGIVSFHLARKQYAFPVVAIVFALLMCLGITLHHETISDVVDVVLITSIVNFLVLVPMHFLQRNGGFLLRNIVDFFYIFFEDVKVKPVKSGKKRILIYNWRDTRHEFAGGAEVYIHELAKRWVKAGNTVTVFSGNDSMCSRHDTIDGVHIVRRGGFYMVYFWAFVYYVFKFHNKFDIIIDSENGIPFFTPLYAREKIFLLMHHVHQDVFRKNLLPPWSWIASFLEGKLMPFVYRNIQIITVSPSSKEDILKYKLATIEPVIVYNGIDTDLYKPGIKSSHPLILYVGRLKHYKRINIFMKTARLIAAKIPTAEFVIAGGGEADIKLMAYAKKLGMEDKLQFTGKISEAEKIALYQKAWVFVNPSSMEGWGITSIEANACATPIVAANVPGLRDSVKNGYNGFLVDSADEHDFEAAIMRLIKDAKLRRAMMKNAVEWASNFCWSKSAELGYKIITK